MSTPVAVLGLDGSGLCAAAAALLAQADLVVGGARQLASVEVPPHARTVVLGDVHEAVRTVAQEAGRVVVLASGDPGYFGIVRRLRAEGLDVQVHPAASSVALAFARAGIEWDDARVVSVHGRDPRAGLAAVRAGGKLAVLTDSRTGPREVALVAPAQATLVVAERLGEPDERVTRGTPHQIAAGQWSEPNVVLVLDGRPPAAPAWQAGPPSVRGWALPDDAFCHRDGMLTKQDVRAQVLARLAPRSGDLVWDVGAGSGSVAIECARLGAAVVAVEQAGTAELERNVAAHGVHLQVVAGRAPAALADLPDPDAVFVGGGGPEVVRAVAARAPERLVVTLATLERVGPVLAQLAGWRTDTVLVQTARLAPLADGHRLVPTNPVFVVTGQRP